MAKVQYRRGWVGARPLMSTARSAIACLCVAMGAILIAPTARSGTIYVVNNGSGTVGKYDTSGTAIDASLITGDLSARAVGVSGTDLYVSNFLNNGTVGKFTTSGGIINSTLLTNLGQPTGIGVAGTELFIATAGENAAGKYTTSGGTINPALFPLIQEQTLTVSGGYVYVASSNGQIRKFATDGALVNSFFITGLGPITAIVVAGNFVYTIAGGGIIGKFTTDGQIVSKIFISTNLPDAYGLAESEGRLYVTNFFPFGSVSVYDETSGALLNPNLISGLNRPMGIVVTSDVPLPAPVWSGLALGAPAVLICTRYRRRRVLGVD